VLDRQMRYVLAEGQELRNIGFGTLQPIGERLLGREHLVKVETAEEQLAGVFEGKSTSFDIDLGDSVYNLVAVPLPDACGEVKEILVVLKNITERKVYERKLVKTIEKEKELGALKSRFVTMASHEFRTPLATMLSSVFLLQNYTGEKYEAQKATHLDRIRRSIDTLTELMNDFLSAGSLEEGRIKAVYSAVDLSAFMKELLAELNAIKKPGQRLILSLDLGEVPEITTDRKMLMNILRNLGSNAIKYSPEGGEIRLDGRIRNGHLILAVSDEGIGIPETEQGEIFKRFYRAENAVNIQGTGLGLNIVKKYTELLHGKVWFESEVNRGTTFTVSLPLQREERSHDHELIS